jgi:hypothetical protein
MPYGAAGRDVMEAETELRASRLDLLPERHLGARGIICDLTKTLQLTPLGSNRVRLSSPAGRTEPCMNLGCFAQEPGVY